MFTNTQQNNSPQVSGSVQPPINTLQKQPSSKNIGSPMHTKMTLSGVPADPSYLDVWQEKETTMNTRYNAPMWSVLQSFILPVHLSNGETNQASLQTWQTFNIEPFIVPRGISGGGGTSNVPGLNVTISSRLSRLATLDVREFTSGGAQNATVEFFKTMDAEGRGGMLADIAGFLANTFLPGSGSTVSGLLGTFGL